MSNAYSDMVVCKFYKLARIDGVNFTKDHKEILRSRAVITKRFMEQVNVNWKSNGKLYILDQQATDQYHEDSKRDYDLRQANKQLSSKGLKQLGEGLTQLMADNIANEPKKPVIKKEEPPKEDVKEVVPPVTEETEGAKLSRLRGEAKELGVKHAHVMGVEKLEEVIKNSQPASTEAQN